MALTISTHPTDVVTNAPEFTVSTSLTESASVQNLRVRATIYVGGETEAVAVLEQPKGLNDWQFFEILKSFAGKCDAPFGDGDTYIGPTLSSELLTGWSEYDANFTTWSVSGRQIINAVTTVSEDFAQSNDLGSAAIGDVYLVTWEEDYSDIGAIDIYFTMSQTGNPLTARDVQAIYAGLNGSGKYDNNRFAIFCMPYDDTTPYIFLGSDISGTQFDGTFSIKKISDFRNNPGVYFTIKFEEVYENASDVTVVTGTTYSQSLLFMPVVLRPGEAWTDFYVTASTGRVLSRADPATSTDPVPALFKYGIGMEIRYLFVSPSAFVRTSMTIDGGINTETNIQFAGWGMVICHSEGGFISNPDAEDETIAWTISGMNNGGSINWTIASFTIPCETRCFPDIKCLSFVGDLGEETILFRGLHTETGQAEKTYYKNINMVRRVLRAFKRTRVKLRSLVETQAVRRLMHEAIYTETDVWMYDSDQTDGYREVVIIDDSIVIGDKNELIESTLDVEYYE